MRMLRRALAMPFVDKVLLIRAWGVLAFVRCALWLAGFPSTKRWLDRWHAPVERLVANRRPAARIARLVEIASHFFPGGRHCLTRAMTLEALLRRRGYPARMEIGVARAAEPRNHGSRLLAHAWVTCGDRVLLGGPEFATFKNLTSSVR